MEVILVKPIRSLGVIGQVIDVKCGYARNYLFPNQIAIRATDNNRQLIESQKQDLEKKDSEVKAEAARINEMIKNKDLIFIRQSGDDGKLFGSVTNKEIARDLSKLVSVTIPYSSIVLEKPIKSIGLFLVSIRLHATISTDINIIVARSDSEALNYIQDKQDLNLS